MLGKTKGTLEQLEPVVAWDPPPCYVSHFSKLREGFAAAKVVLSPVTPRFTSAPPPCRSLQLLLSCSQKWQHSND